MSEPQEPDAGGTAATDDETIEGELVDQDDSASSSTGDGHDNVVDADVLDTPSTEAADAGTTGPASGVPAAPIVGATPATPATPAAPTAPTAPTFPATPASAFDYTDAGVPTLNYVRDKIEQRHGTALGSAELTGATDAAERQRKADEERTRLAAEKLAEIRRQVDGDSAATGSARPDGGEPPNS